MIDMNKTNNDLTAHNSFLEFKEKESKIYYSLNDECKLRYASSGYLWIIIIDNPAATMHKWELYCVKSELNHRHLFASNTLNDFYDTLEFTTSKTVRTIYAKATEIAIEHLKENPNSKISILDIGK